MVKSILATKTRDNSQVTIYLDGVHYRKTRQQVDIEKLWKAAQDYRQTGSKEALDRLETLLNPKGTLAKKLFSGKFYSDGENVFLEGDDIPVPSFLVQTMKEYEENGWNLDPLINFWILARLNPNPHSRDSFFDYCTKYGVNITDHGYAVLYKAVTHKKKVTENKDLARVIGEGAIKVKSQKKGLQRFTVYQNKETEEYRISEYGQQDDEEIVGNLQELYDKLDEISKTVETIYTDKHTRKMDIYLGVPVRMPRELCDSDIGTECSKGLHVGSHNYVSRYADRGDTILACLVSPMNIVAVPTHSNISGTGGSSKIRCCEYLPRGIMEGGEKGEWKELESSYHEDDYMGYELKMLKEAVEKGEIPDERKEVVSTRLVSLEKEGVKRGELPAAVIVYEEEDEDGEASVRVINDPNE